MEDKEFELWEKTVEEIIAENNILLKEFELWLETKKLSPKTLKKHVNNIDFFVNNYLVHYEPIKAEDGAVEIGGFLGDYFIRKALWSTKNSIIEYISSFRKFYTFMVEVNKTSEDDLIDMKEIIKEEREDWFDSLQEFDNQGFY